MKKILSLMILGLFVISSLSLVSASTMIAGKIYDGDGNLISGADVEVTCDSNVQETTSNSEGDYAVTYSEFDCNSGDSLSVYAEKEDMSGSKTGTIIDNVVDDWDVAIVNVIIPEFGLYMGVITAIAGLGIFFLIRRK